MTANHRPGFTRNITVQVSTPTGEHKPGTPGPTSSIPPTMHIKRVTLTSKKNWWMVEMDEEEDQAQLNASMNSFSSSEDTAVDTQPVMYKEYNHGLEEHRQHSQTKDDDSPPPSPVYHPSRHPNSIFSFPTPTAYAAPPDATASLTPFAHGSASELFKCVVKKPDVIQLEINGEMQSNSSDVTVQFLAELRVYTSLSRHRNICAFFGCLENVGIVLEYLDCRTLYDVIVDRPPLNRSQKINYHNQLLDGLTHLHSYRLSHGDLSLLNVQVTRDSNTVKLLDFGRSVSADSTFKSPDDDPVDPFPYIQNRVPQPKIPSVRVEQIHPGTRPFSAPEILRGECQDPLLADAYSFGMILICLDRCESVDVKPWDQRKDKHPADLFNGCEIFEERAREYLRKCKDGRRRLEKKDRMLEPGAPPCSRSSTS
ncbi:kinase-like domain-containing protein [Coprinopsis sp. MPI-PUGE-AT-0042]|nr:kinase-like domain-containing protein [Coprinopsis sp. MPI-PUGE-AT-0042]